VRDLNLWPSTVVIIAITSLPQKDHTIESFRGLTLLISDSH